MPCGSSVHFVPRQFGLSSAMVLVTDLQPDSNYSFTVESQNGVSDLSPTPRGTVVINVTTSQTGESALNPDSTLDVKTPVFVDTEGCHRITFMCGRLL